jgi:pyruvate/2-oxoglutarate/acetoin dehydrogenase E1 component
MSSYFGALCDAMNMLAGQPRAIFLGQSVGNPGTGMSKSFANIPKEKLLEMPVAEDLQLGMSIGLALAGDLPVSVFPRINFIFCAMSQLVLHLDAIPCFSRYRPRVIIRTAVGNPEPLNPGPQHTGDYADALRSLLKTVAVVQLEEASQIVPCYAVAMARETSSVIIEYPSLYETGK